MGSGDMNGVGNALANVITGSVGKNLLKGMEGDDTLLGGRGADSLYGGTGKDTFVFSTLRDSTVSETGRDTIFGFSQTERDRIDLSGIDAKAPSTTNDAFTFVGTKDFSKKAGELRFEKTATDTYIYGDVDGNGRADFAIHLNAAVTLVKGDFIL
jgi:Ca2+-binding RTX toxin-like protein